MRPPQRPSWNSFEDVGDLPQNLGTEIEHLFRAYTLMEAADWEVGGWADAAAAIDAITRAQRRYGVR